ncbi:hypothetical protein FJTKL_15304 [Diaporthe vaccinii]|uniref:Peptidase M16 C-terminal domain-containing protein n=1 Tax=Diaporthe vaccinii TaxID=105482 RepID=A0ABR4E5B0_9PEZI
MFIDPTFTLDTVGCEFEVVEGEFRRNERFDPRRVWQLEASTSNPEHPRSWSFSCGNLDSFGDPAKLLTTVVEYCEENYCAGLMQCVIFTPLPIKDLQDRLLPTFAEIPNRGLSRKVWDTIPCYLEKDMGTVTFVEPVSDVDMLLINFYFPGKEDDGYSARGENAVDLLEDKAEGGLYNVLKGKELIQYLSARTSYEHTGYRKITILAHLTEAGAKNYPDVVQEVCHMIVRMKGEGPQQKRVEEQERLRHIQFCTSQAPDMAVASNIARYMLEPHLQPENLVYGSNEISIESWFSAEDIARTTGQLRPENMRLVLVPCVEQPINLEWL